MAGRVVRGWGPHSLAWRVGCPENEWGAPQGYLTPDIQALEPAHPEVKRSQRDGGPQATPIMR